MFKAMDGLSPSVVVKLESGKYEIQPLPEDSVFVIAGRNLPIPLNSQAATDLNGLILGAAYGKPLRMAGKKIIRRNRDDAE